MAVIYKILSQKWGARFGLLGLIALVALVVGMFTAAFTGGAKNATNTDCSAKLEQVTPSWKQGDGFKILGVVPDRTSVDRVICIVVAGLSPTNDTGLKAVDLKLFLNDVAASHVEIKGQSKSSPQIVTFRLSAPPNATTVGAAFWRDLLSGSRDSDSTWLEIGEREVTVGLSRSGASSPETTAPGPTTVVIYDVLVFWIGVVAFVLLFLSFCSFARNSTLLRDNARTVGDYRAEAAAAQEAFDQAARVAKDGEAELRNMSTQQQAAEQSLVGAPNDPTKQQAVADAKSAFDAVEVRLASAKKKVDEFLASKLKADKNLVSLGALLDSDNPNMPTGSFSLAKSQMAFWLLLTASGFVFIWMSVGQYYNLVTAGVLVLLGISGVTGLASVTLNDSTDGETRTSSFLADILNDGDGPKLYRIQAVAWTLILGVIFMWNVFWNFRFVEFDPNLLLMVGIAQSLYLGFKPKEKSGS
ncbi:hypothetical protein [Mesorhizobium sp. M0138]|uniref:hypothetical protein n=1 Tax=Mesorhizobium sp. M0138 TaxID=2956891 RepID=UPI003338B2C3